MNNLKESYFLHRISNDYQADANILLATTGVLKSVLGTFSLVISKCEVTANVHSDKTFQSFYYDALVLDQKNNTVLRLSCQGSPNQCFEYLSHKFQKLLSEYGDAILLFDKDEKPEDLAVSDTKQQWNLASDRRNLSSIQDEVDTWIHTVGIRYFSELTNLSNLIEEVGELARLIGRVYGEQSFKPDERPNCIKSAIADELADVLFILVCLANQCGIDLDEAYLRNMAKKTKRDAHRHHDNLKLNLGDSHE